MKRQMKRMLACSGCILLSATACLQTPDMEYVANKEEQGTLIQDYMEADSGIPLAQRLEAPAKVTHSCENVNPYTTITIDANVIIPDCTAIPVYTVEAMDINEETIEHYTEVLYETGELYNREYEWDYGSIFPTKDLTTDQLYAIIDDYEQMLESAEVTDVPEPVWDEYGHILELNEDDLGYFENRMEGYRSRIPESEERITYGSPVRYAFANHSIDTWYGFDDYAFQSVAYSGLYNGVEHDLLLYRDSMNSELQFGLPANIRLENGYTLNEFRGGSYDEYWLCMKIGDSTYVQKPNTCRYSEEEAVNLCRDFMSELGIEGMAVQQVEQVSMIKYPTLRNEIFLGNKGYRICFGWGTENMTDDYSIRLDSEIEFVENYMPYCSVVQHAIQHPDNYNSIYRGSYGDEDFIGARFPSMAEFTVLDDGIIKAWIVNPLTNPELQAENVRLLNFDRVLQQGIAQLEVLYGDSGNKDAHGKVNKVDIKITAICLHYARMQSPDTEGEFTMIPVWDFKTGGSQGETILSINAIDGTVFDRQKGY